MRAGLMMVARTRARGTRGRPPVFVTAQPRRAAAAGLAPARLRRPSLRAASAGRRPYPGQSLPAWPELPTRPAGHALLRRPRPAQTPGGARVLRPLPEARPRPRPGSWRPEASSSRSIARFPPRPKGEEAGPRGQPVLRRRRLPGSGSGGAVAEDALGAPESAACGGPRTIRARPPQGRPPRDPAAWPLEGHHELDAIASAADRVRYLP